MLKALKENTAISKVIETEGEMNIFSCFEYLYLCQKKGIYHAETIHSAKHPGNACSL